MGRVRELPQKLGLDTLGFELPIGEISHRGALWDPFLYEGTAVF